ncbi:bifunctional nitric oxide dioxygenase/dihydropteridine reductase 2 [Paraburkholderia hospita]|uniref:Flavohemoprotein n=1 Tax=Paraburkholderia hospita TaxID=169430 RepID=A0ABN0F3D9_9BURK|nr:NO-inducible flavohemoprotein [Paraburkholderia hospita]EIM93079.1 bifunctional nitric oxide dioxygenase/dihydropteridine reductase 2 [Paraburkholderia hospita]OUL82649.1 nitric oxide dioxygenase [Paraburkholderia hospita]
MLSAEHRAIVKATVPLLETGGEALTTHFYKTMLSEYPGVRPLFNQAHQQSSDQPRALANAVLTYARHIDELGQLGGLVSQIVNKHVALNILPEHYPIVGGCLLRAIREVLGAEIATDAVIEAWAAAYQQLSDLLIGLEEKVYVEKETATGGWRGTRAFAVARKVKESDEIMSFYLRPADGGDLLEFKPGQYIGLRLIVEGEEIRRNYSLSAAANGREYRISVKREPNGKGSNFLHDSVHEGSTLNLFPPSGDFTLEDSDKPLVLISGGVGITPTLAMLTAALQTSRPIHFIHAARHGGVHAFRDTIDDLAGRHPQLTRFYVYEKPRQQDDAYHAEGYIDEARLNQWLPATRDLDVYFLGPKPFMKAVKRHLKAIGVPEKQSRYEFFGPASELD